MSGKCLDDFENENLNTTSKCNLNTKLIECFNTTFSIEIYSNSTQPAQKLTCLNGNQSLKKICGFLEESVDKNCHIIQTNSTELVNNSICDMLTSSKNSCQIYAIKFTNGSIYLKRENQCPNDLKLFAMFGRHQFMSLKNESIDLTRIVQLKNEFINNTDDKFESIREFGYFLNESQLLILAVNSQESDQKVLFVDVYFLDETYLKEIVENNIESIKSWSLKIWLISFLVIFVFSLVNRCFIEFGSSKNEFFNDFSF